MKIIQAAGPEELDTVRRLFREYEAFLNVDLCFQGFEEELAGLPGKYAPPGGRLLLARQGRHAAGCAALRHLEGRACEMKRLYVRPAFRGRGLGRVLAGRILAAAAQAGYNRICLDTLDRLREAMALYRSLGFREAAPYYRNPLPGVVYWKLDLDRVPAADPGNLT